MGWNRSWQRRLGRLCYVRGLQCMKLIDRFLVLRRAFLVALNPSCESVIITRMDKNGELHKNCIWSKKEIGKDAYLKDLQRMFLDHAKSGSYLNNTALVFLKGIQDKWNSDNPNDQVEFIKEVDNDKT